MSCPHFKIYVRTALVSFRRYVHWLFRTHEDHPPFLGRRLVRRRVHAILFRPLLLVVQTRHRHFRTAAPTGRPSARLRLAGARLRGGIFHEPRGPAGLVGVEPTTQTRRRATSPLLRGPRVCVVGGRARRATTRMLRQQPEMWPHHQRGVARICGVTAESTVQPTVPTTAVEEAEN